MKKNSSSLRLCVLLCATFFLTACMGGGSGGGGAGSGGGGGISFPGPITQGDGIASMITLEEIADAPRIAQLGEAFGLTVAGKTIPEMWLPTAGLANSEPWNNINGFRDYFDFGHFGEDRPPNSLYVHLEPGSNIFRVYNENENFWLDISPEFFTVFNNGLIGAITSDISVKRNGNLWSATFYNGVGGNTQRQEDIIGDAYEIMKASGATGEMRLFETIMLAGHPVGLEYTNFGFWEARFMADGIIDGQSVNSAISSYVPFMLVAANAEKLAPNVGAFNGLVVANAYDRSDDLNSKSVSLTGTASLNVTSPTAGNISFDFNNFYKLSTNLNISGSGGITQSGAFVVTPQGANSTGINLAGGGTGSVTGQFYGDGGLTTATEAVGTFGYSENSGLVGVRGAFGVKAP